MAGRYSLFLQEWSDGCGSSICEGATKVFARGNIPSDIAFIGEAPGESEDVMGVPFAGPAGHLLDQIIERSIGEENLHRTADHVKLLSFCIMNLVGCIPRTSEGSKATEPEHEDIMCCRPRLEQLLGLVRPRLVIAVGKLAENYTASGFKHTIKFPRPIKVVAMVHPAAILRTNVAMQGLAMQRCIVTLKNAIEGL